MYAAAPLYVGMAWDATSAVVRVDVACVVMFCVVTLDVCSTMVMLCD